MVSYLQTSPLVKKWGWDLRFCLPFMKNIYQVWSGWRAASMKGLYAIPKAQQQNPFRREEKVTGNSNISQWRGLSQQLPFCTAALSHHHLNRDLHSTACSKGTKEERYWKSHLLGFSAPLLIWGTNDGVFLIWKFKKNTLWFMWVKNKNEL